MMMRKLGRSGVSVSGIGLGCWAIGGVTWRDGKPCGWAGADDTAAIAAIHEALERGVNFLDTADVYGCGHSERLIAKAIRGRRDKLILATKFGFPINEGDRTTSGERCEPEYIRSACDASLRRLETDHIDLYQFHLGGSSDGVAVRETLEQLVIEGKIRYYGWSTDQPDKARIFAEGKHCVAIQQHFNVVSGNEETLRVCEENGLASINRGPLGMGILTGKFTAETKFPPDDVRHSWDLAAGNIADHLKKFEAVRDILTTGGRTLSQGAICWLWARSPVTIPIPGFKNVAQVTDNAGALKFAPLAEDQMQEIDRLLSRAVS
ncbi:MAG: aldo/keto reductase [Candidatus Hydrogenedentes bacterium]|nr:aldo/keto reductase [Candidatus Hydrogenedentota bacterium]